MSVSVFVCVCVFVHDNLNLINLNIIVWYEKARTSLKLGVKVMNMAGMPSPVSYLWHMAEGFD